MKTRIWSASIVVLLAAWACSKKGQESDAATTANAVKSQAEPGADGVQAIPADIKSMDELVDLIVAQAADLPRSEFDPAALSEKLGKDPNAHFTWVRDNTGWAPYRGLLRGSKGVML